jgi:hypothetical protein
MLVRKSLIRDAQLLTTGAEIHDTNQFIAMYRGAASSGHQESFILFEQNLESHVAQLKAKRSRLCSK